MMMMIRNIGGATLKKDSAKADLDVMYLVYNPCPLNPFTGIKQARLKKGGVVVK